MKTSTAAFSTSVDQRDQTVAYTVSIDLPGGLQIDASHTSVNKIEIDGSTVTDQAGGTRLEEGYTAYEATIGISGRVDPNDETKTAAWFFARYPFPAKSDGSLSPIAYQTLHGCLVTIKFGPTDADAIEVFAGYPDSYTQTSDGDVEITCIDFRQKLRGTVELVPVITPAPYNAGLTSEFAIDAILRKATVGAVSSWPAQRPQCLLAIGMRASLWPEAGTLRSAVNQDGSAFTGPSFVPGKWGSALAGTPDGKGYILGIDYGPTRPITRDDTIINLEMVANPNGGVTVQISDGAPAYNSAFIVTVNSNQVFVQAVMGSGDTWSTPTPTDNLPHYIAVSINYPYPGTTWSVTVRIDGTTVSSGTRTVGTRTATPLTDAYLMVLASGYNTSVEALQIWTGAVTTWNDAFTPGAALDPSLNPLQVVPPVSGDPWQVIQQIAAAEQGVAGFFGGRVFKFKNRNTITSAPIARTITSKGALEQIGVSSELAAVINRAQVGYTSWTFAATRSALYQAETVLKIPRKGQITVVVNLDGYAVDVDTIIATLPDGNTDQTQSWVRFATTAAGAARHPGGVYVTLTPTAPDKISIVINNTSNIDAYSVSSAEFLDMTPGTVVFRIAGRVVAPVEEVTADYQWPTLDMGGAASTAYGEILAEVKGNPWIQFLDPATALCKALVLDNYQPRAEFTDIAVSPDPRIEPADGLHLIDSDRTGVDDYVRVFGFRLQLEVNDDGQLTYAMQLDARALGTPGGWLLGIPGRSELGVTTYLR